MNQTATSTPQTTSPLFGYAPPHGVFDETIDAQGNIRPHWRSLITGLESLGRDELQRRWEQAQRQISDDGVTYNPHDVDGESSRPWVLDAIPLVLAEREWRQVAHGLEQRARLLDMVLRDLLGPQQLLRDRVVPPDVLFGNPSFYPAYHRLHPPNKQFLHISAADLTRAPDGSWWVTGDRSGTPFGLGYVLENRIITSRMLPGIFRQSGVHRLASFFIQLRETLRECATRFRENPRIALWTQGPKSRSYFEDAYLARYLGYTLVEGGDLAVRENRVMLKTLGGLLPIEVLFRRLDDDNCDAVELRGSSRVGVAGLVEVMRSGNVSLVNPLGSRLIESPILFAYLPGVCRYLLGEELQLPSVATWWCGEPSALKYVMEHLDDLLIRRAFRTVDEPPIHPAKLTESARARLVEALKARPADYVGQESIARSTSPVWTNDGIASWHVGIRGYLVANRAGYTALPGGLARVSPETSILDYTMTSGERSQDVWILADGPIEEVSLLTPPGQTVVLRRGGADLPSRVADSLYWLGRNVERADGTARLLRTVFASLTGESEQRSQLQPLLRALAEHGQIEPDYVVAGLNERLPDIAEMLPEEMFNPSRRRSLRATIDEAVRLVSMVRDRVSVDAWRIIHRLDAVDRRPRRRRTHDASHVLTVLDRLITELAAFAGLVNESMTRTQGWRFLDLGRRIERTTHTALLLRSTMTHRLPDERPVLEAILQTADSIMTLRTRYLGTVEPAAVLDLLLTDETNPRSIAYQLSVIKAHVDELPRDETQAIRTPEEKLAMSLLNMVRMADVFELIQIDSDAKRPSLERLLLRLSERLPKLSDAVSGRFLTHAGLPRHFSGTGDGKS